MRPPHNMQNNIAYIGLGANLGDALTQVVEAAKAIGQLSSVTLDALSSLYKSAPVGATGDDYINAVVRVRTSLDADNLLTKLFEIEQMFGRKRPYVNAPRTLDLDLLLFNTEIRQTPRLILPHPRMHERAFVLLPLIEIWPDATIPGKGKAALFTASVTNQPITKLQPFPV